MKLNLKIRDTLTDTTGTITYDDKKSPVKYKLEMPNDIARKTIDDYLQRKRGYEIPESDQIDDYRHDEAVPTELVTYFELALSEMLAQINVELLKYE